MTEGIQYDVFISYSSRDRTIAEELAIRLREAGLSPFFDRWCLPGGKPWGSLLEQSIKESCSCTVLIGKEGFGPWQKREMWVALDRQGRDADFPVIPTILPGADEVPSLFLRLNTWVDMRRGVGDEAAFQMLLKAIRGEAMGGPVFEELAEAVRPYLGLRAFREEDAAFFFGREAVTERLIGAVERTPFQAVVGPSGSGKSSVVQAGLIPALRKGAVTGSGTWEFAVFRPGKNPLKQLAAPLVSLLEPEMDEVTRLAKVGELADYLKESRVSLADATGRILRKQPGAERLVLVADQFEELFTYKESEPEREIFLSYLLEAAEEWDGPLVVILTLRADFYSHCLKVRPLADRLEGRLVNIGPMTEEELRHAVEEPAGSVGVRFEAGLVERILEDVRGEPGALPLLEFALTELWNRRRGGMLTHKAYKNIGQVQGAIAQRAETEYGRLKLEEQEIARRVFVQLVRPAEEGTKDTRRRAGLLEIPLAGTDPEAVHQVVKSLADARLVVTGREETSGEETMEVAHEALIQGWRRFQRWMDEDRAFRTWQERIRAAIRVWEEKGRDEGALLRGALLAEAEEWAETHAADLNSLEREFVQASIKLRGRHRVAGLTLGGAIGAGLSVGLLRAVIEALAPVGMVGVQFAIYFFCAAILGAALSFGMALAEYLLLSRPEEASETPARWLAPLHPDRLPAVVAAVLGTLFFWIGHAVVTFLNSFPSLSNTMEPLRVLMVFVAGLGLSVALYGQPRISYRLGLVRSLLRPGTVLRLGTAALSFLMTEWVFIAKDRGPGLNIVWSKSAYKAKFYDYIVTQYPQLVRRVPRWSEYLALLDAALVGIVLTIGITAGLVLAADWLARWRILVDRADD